MWCIGKITGGYLAKMEDVLALYDLPYDPDCPVVKVDEMPFQMLASLVEPLPMKPGTPLREDYRYERKGSCNVFVALENHTGRRWAKVCKHKTNEDYARFMEMIAEAFPEASKIIVVQDNLSTHHAGAFYDCFDAEKAFALAQKFEFHYTPNKASWLNMVEIEISAITTQCLGRRIESMEILEKEIQAIVKERNDKKIKVNWQFTIPKARMKLKRHYPNS
jgi:hypothetical protein